MIFVIGRLFVTRQNAYILNRVYNNSKSLTNCACQLHIFRNEHLPLVGLRHLNALQTIHNSRESVNQAVYTPVRFKSSKKNRKLNRNAADDDDDGNEEEDSDDEQSSFDEFRQGDKASDRNLVEIKVQTLRLDTVIKAGLGFSKK